MLTNAIIKPTDQHSIALGGPQGAAFIACVLLDLQDSPVTHAQLFSGDSSPFGLFTQHGEPKKTYYAMLAFRQLLETPQRVATSGTIAGEVNAMAGMNSDKSELTLLVSNYKARHERFSIELKSLPWRGQTQVQCSQLNAHLNLEPITPPTMSDDHKLTLALPAPAVAVIKFTPATK